MENAKIFITTSSATVPFHHTMENTVKTVRISLSIFNSLRSSFEFSAVYVKRTFHQTGFVTYMHIIHINTHTILLKPKVNLHHFYKNLGFLYE